MSFATKEDTTPNYRMNCGQYVLHRGDQPVGRVLDEVFMAIDKEEGILHKHGEQSMVEAWVESAKQKMAGVPFGESLADNLVVFGGRFHPDDINKCISNSGFVGVLYRQALAGTLRGLDVMGSEVPGAGAQ